MEINKKYIVAFGIGLVTITGAIGYLQYKKIMDYTIKLKNVIVNSISATLLDLTLNLNYQNKSNFGFVIESQSYDVYINNSLIAKLKNQNPIKIEPKSITVIPLNVKVNPSKAISDIKLNLAQILLKPESVVLRIETKLKVKIWLFSVNIPYNYSATFKELMAAK